MATKHPKPDYKIHTLGTTGEEVKVFAVPQNIFKGIIHKPKPPRPQIDMELRGGKKQKRWAKQGDPEFDIWQEDVEVWEEDRQRLQEDVTLVLSVREYPCNGTTILEANADELEFPPYVLQLIRDNILEMPDHPYAKKAMWLREKAIGQNDELEVGFISQELSGVPEEFITQMKESFRNFILGKNDEGMGESSGT